MFIDQGRESAHLIELKPLNSAPCQSNLAKKKAETTFESLNMQKTVNSKQEVQLKQQHSKYLSYFNKYFMHSEFGKTSTSQQSHAASTHDDEKPFVLTLRQFVRKVHPLSNVTVMLKTQYNIITSLAHRYFNFKFYNKQDHFDDNFLIWVDSYVTEQFVKRLKSYQKINHFPNSCELGRKDLLSLNLKLAQLAMPHQYAFYPKTWVLPNQYDSFCCQKSKDKFYIVKPHANCQGRGIYIAKSPGVSRKDEVVVQEYVQRPMLLEGSKFDLRIYVLLRSLSPLRIYMYREGLCRLATSKYSPPDDKNVANEKMHLTNYAINKHSPSFVPNRDLTREGQGHKRSYTSLLRALARRGFNAAEIQERIESVIVRTVMAAHSKLAHSYKKARQQNVRYRHNVDNKAAKDEAFSKILQFNPEEPSVCFELLGFDILLLESGEPLLIEVNHQPSLVTDSPFDLTLKRCLLMDTINLLSIDEKEKECWQKCQLEGSVYRSANLEQHQMQNMGGFSKIYPVPQVSQVPQCSSEGRAERAQAKKIVYETILNNFLFSEYKRKIRLTDYKTIAYRPPTNQNTHQVTHHNIPSNPHHALHTSSDTRKRTQQRTLALTFFNLFNDPDFRLKRNNFKMDTPPTDTLPRSANTIDDDCFIRNHISQENPMARKQLISKMKAKVEQRLRERQEEKASVSGEKERGNSNLEKIYLKRISLCSDEQRSKQLEIKNRGITNYGDHRSNKQTAKMLSQVVGKIDSEDHQHSTLHEDPRRFDGPIGQAGGEPIGKRGSQSEAESEGRRYFREKYGPSIRQKLQRISHIATMKSQIRKYNFNNFLQRAHSKQGPSEGKVRMALSLQKTHPSQG